MIFDKMLIASTSLITKIHHQPFNLELAKGILSSKIFNYYLQQDILYLSDFSRALALTAARLPENHQAKQFMQFAVGAIQAEQALHLSYLETHPHQLGIEQNAACFMYTNYILRLASTASVEEAVAGLLPCFWVYREVGAKLFESHASDHPYKNWIELYSGEAFAASVASAINITNELSASASEHTKQKMIAAFIRATQLEWYFWESAYKQEQWFI